MGCCSSIEEPDEIKIQAARKYHERMRSYNYFIHGPYEHYVEWCRGQFQLECMPDHLRYGANYNPHTRYCYDSD
jgi:hypothetical protein